MNKLNKKGFGVIEGILIVLLLALIGGAGFYVYKANKTEESSQNNNEISTLEPSKTELAENDNKKVYKIGFADKFYYDTSFKAPQDWDTEAFVNGIGLESPDYSISERAITTGAQLSVVIDSRGYYDKNKSLDDNLYDEAIAGYGVAPLTKEYKTVAGQRAIVTSDNFGMNSNTKIILIMDNNWVRATLSYKRGSPNPYPKVIDGILSSLSFKKVQ